MVDQHSARVKALDTSWGGALGLVPLETTGPARWTSRATVKRTVRKAMTTHMKWSEKLFGTGIPEVDEQHKELFSRVNALLDACSRGDGAAAVRSTLEFLEGYMEQHFARHRLPLDYLVKAERGHASG